MKTNKVRIEFHDEQAQEVCIAGTFNDWRDNATPMISMGQGKWMKELSLAPGRYEYCLVVDGHWRTHPAATESVPNAYGSCNSVLTVIPRESARGKGHSGPLP